jgi:type IVB pilus formation R64 PilN family outer membrane protein
MLTNKIKLLCLSAVIAISGIALNSCSTDTSNSVSLQIKDDFMEASEAIQRAKKPTRTTVNDTVSATKGIWLGNTSTKRQNRNPLPKKFETAQGITIITDDAVSIYDLANQIHELTGINVNIDDLVNKSDLKNIKVNHMGKLSDLLTKIATQMSLRWYYDKGTITFYQQQTKTFTLYALATDTTFKSKIAPGDDSSESHVTTGATLNEWTEIKDALGKVVPTTLGSYTISPSTGTITVTAAPPTLNRVGEYIRNINNKITKQVAISVTVLQVSLNDSDAVGVDLDMAFRNTSTGLGFASNVANTFASGGTSQNNFNFKVVDGKNSFGQFDGTNAAIKALSEQGKVSIVTTSVVTVRNNKIAPINNLRKEKIITEYKTDTDEDGNTTIDYETEDITVGFNMQVMPNILENGRLLLMFNMTLNELLEIKEYNLEDNLIQLPVTEERKFQQEIIMESDQTLIMSGFEKIENRDVKQGVGNPEFMLFGGGKSTGSTRDVLVVIITPQVLRSPLDPESRRSNVWGTPDFTN